MSRTTTLPPASAHFISLSTAVDMTTAYRSNKESILATAYQGQNILANSETFNREAFDSLLGKDDCAGLRIYYGMDDSLKVHAIIVAVNDSNEDILPALSTAAMRNDSDDDGDIVEEGQRCPDLCPPPSPLNE